MPTINNLLEDALAKCGVGEDDAPRQAVDRARFSVELMANDLHMVWGLEPHSGLIIGLGVITRSSTKRPWYAAARTRAFQPPPDPEAVKLCPELEDAVAFILQPEIEKILGMHALERTAH